MTTPDVRCGVACRGMPRTPSRSTSGVRREGDVVWDDTAAAWLILGYHPARQILAGPAGPATRWRAQPGPTSGVQDPDIVRRNMLTTDGADHQRLRGAVRDVFTRNLHRGLHDGIEAIAAETIDSHSGRSRVRLHDRHRAAASHRGRSGMAGAGRRLRATAACEESPAITRMLGDFGDTDAVDAAQPPSRRC